MCSWRTNCSEPGSCPGRSRRAPSRYAAQRALRAGQDRRLGLARATPRREHVEHHDLAARTRARLCLRRGTEHRQRQLQSGASGEPSLRHLRVDRGGLFWPATPNASRASSPMASVETTPGMMKRRIRPPKITRRRRRPGGRGGQAPDQEAAGQPAPRWPSHSGASTLNTT